MKNSFELGLLQICSLLWNYETAGRNSITKLTQLMSQVENCVIWCPVAKGFFFLLSSTSCLSWNNRPIETYWIVTLLNWIVTLLTCQFKKVSMGNCIHSLFFQSKLGSRHFFSIFNEIFFCIKKVTCIFSNLFQVRKKHYKNLRLKNWL